MRCFLILVLSIFSFQSKAQLNDFIVRDLENITKVEKKQLKDILARQRYIFAVSPNTDTMLFNMINDYRKRNDLIPLKHSIRLDTLSRLVGKTIIVSGHLAHYPLLPELRHVKDLLNVENLAYNMSSDGFNLTTFRDEGNSADVVSLEKILQKWIKSPGHNRNLLVDLPCGTVTILLRIEFSKGSYVIETVCVYEADNTFSKREAAENLKAKNRELILLPKMRKPN